MIVVVGDLGAETSRASAANIAARAVALGSTVEIVGRVPGDNVGDRRLLELAILGIGHAAVLRSTGEAMEAADLELALRYLLGITTIVLIDDGRGDLIQTAVAAAAWGAARLVVIASSVEEPRDLPSDVLVLEPPGRDPDGAFAGFVAALAIRLEAGEEPAAALRSTVEGLAIDPAEAGPA